MNNKEVPIIQSSFGRFPLGPFRAITVTAAAFIFAAFAVAESPTPANQSAMPTENVNVVNTPTVNVGSLPPVSISGTPAVTVGSLPPVSLAGTPTVNANVVFPATQAVTLTAPGPLTNVGRLPSQQLSLLSTGPLECPSTQYVMAPDGVPSCFDIANFPGQILVITDVFWIAQGTPGSTCIMGLGLAGHPGYGPVFWSAAVAGADGIATKTEHLTTGVKITENPLTTFQAGSETACTLAFPGSFMQGYLVPNQ